MTAPGPHRWKSTVERGSEEADPPPAPRRTYLRTCLRCNTKTFTTTNPFLRLCVGCGKYVATLTTTWDDHTVITR